MEIKRFEIDGNAIEFVNESYNTRHGFKHVSTMFINGNEMRSHTCYYYNRTWECYRYQTVMMGLVRDRINDALDLSKEIFKEENGYKKMTPKRQEEFEKFIEHNSIINLCNKILEELR